MSKDLLEEAILSLFFIKALKILAYKNRYMDSV